MNEVYLFPFITFLPSTNELEHTTWKKKKKPKSAKKPNTKTSTSGSIINKSVVTKCNKGKVIKKKRKVRFLASGRSLRRTTETWLSHNHNRSRRQQVGSLTATLPELSFDFIGPFRMLALPSKSEIRSLPHRDVATLLRTLKKYFFRNPLAHSLPNFYTEVMFSLSVQHLDR